MHIEKSVGYEIEQLWSQQTSICHHESDRWALFIDDREKFLGGSGLCNREAELLGCDLDG